ncbi:hypothetical protein N7G274_008813 [Stereocaulon virgatum]|uniref:Uncharacterized protein n=1 Tax=Stereocaulon virgatum TaxID=373712 RepID=A0ABR3ZXR3_9LECA
MKTLSCTHSFAVFLALSVISFQSSFAVPELKAGGLLQPRLAGSAVTSGFTSPTHRRNKCPFTPPSGKESATASVYRTGTIPSASIATSNPIDFPGGNGSTLASHLLYSRSSPCKLKTSTIYLPSQSGAHSAITSAADHQSSEGSPGTSGLPLSNTDTPKSTDSAGSGPPIAGNANPSPPLAMAVGTDTPNPTESANSNTTTPPSMGGSSGVDSSVPGSLKNADSSSPLAGSGNVGSPIPAALPSVCGPQTTVTVTTQYTVIITQAAEAAGFGNAVTSGAPSIDCAAEPALTDIDIATSTGPFANASTGRGTEYSKATGNGSASTSSGFGGLYVNGTQVAPATKAAIQPSAHYALPCPSLFP